MDLKDPPAIRVTKDLLGCLDWMDKKACQGFLVSKVTLDWMA